jgi:hypothetical protein
VYPEDEQSSKFQEMLKESVLVKFISLESKAQHSRGICFPEAIIKEVEGLRGNNIWQENLKIKMVREKKKLRDFQKKYADEDARHREYKRTWKRR